MPNTIPMQTAANVAGRAITSSQFGHALHNVFGKQTWSRLPRTGLAISGGVDSMALLFLWNRFLKEKGLDVQSRSTVFLIDHLARPNSTDEAQQIAAYIKQLTDLDTKVLTLNWGQKDPRNILNFEGYARKIRSQALGRACYRDGISKLMLAHHEDDSMETALHRLSAGSYAEFIRGIDPVSQIPECEGEYGIYESGEPVPFASPQKSQPWCYESGGVSILRPLLAFSKKDLITTCESNQVTWFEDETNHDPTFTTRNAIRSIVDSGELPAALSPDRLRTMMSSVVSRRTKAKEQRNEYLSKCVVQSLDLRCGELTICLPRFKDVFPTMSNSSSFSEKYYLCSVIVAYLRDLVAPWERVTTKKLGPVVNAVFDSEFPELSTFVHKRAGYTGGGSSVEPLDIDRAIKRLSKRRTGKGLFPAEEKRLEQLSVAKDRGFSLWRFSKQPPSKADDVPVVLFTPTMDHNDDHQSLLKWKPRLSITSSNQRQFVLWDSRFWIRLNLRNVDHSVLVMGPTDAALKELSKAFYVAGKEYDNDRNLADWLLHETRSLQNIHAIPALVAPPGLPSIPPGSILALPTYDLVHPEYRGRFHWDVRYKSIDIKPLGLTQSAKTPNLFAGRFPKT